jgi:hypothetical protein
MSTQPEPISEPDPLAEQAYLSIVKRLARGGDGPEVSELRAALEGVGATHDQLTADVAQARCELLELEHLRAEHRENAEHMYTELVCAAAEGLEIDDRTGSAILSAAGRTIADFERDLGELTLLASQRSLMEMTWRAKAMALRRGERTI